MAMAASTARFAERVRSEFAGREFSEDEFRAFSQAEGGCTLATLRRHGVVERMERRYETVGMFMPAEFAAYVSDELIGDDLYDCSMHYEWDAERGLFLELVPEPWTYVVAA